MLVNSNRISYLKFALLIALLGCFFNSVGEVVRIPVVVHVVYSSEDQNISDAQVYSQIEALNRDYRALNSDLSDVDDAFVNAIGDAEIEFKLADFDSEGNAVTGITRTNTSHGVFGNSDIHFTVNGGKDAWDNTKYLNVWVCELNPVFLGWSSEPSTINAQDGVVIDYRNFGEVNVSSAYNKGRTAVHEIGHWLGLTHIEGVGGCDNDDGIDDTPNQSASYSSCTSNRNDCGSYDITQNFMQTGEDDCLLFFTEGQIVAMRSVLNNQRSSILENAESVLAVTRSNYVESSRSIVYPNPVIGNEIVINLPTQGEFVVSINSLLGHALIEKRLSNGGVLDASDIDNGTYLVTITGDTNKWYQKIIIRN